MIELQELSKHYRVHKRPSGMAAALRSLVKRQYTIVKAVEKISFSIAAGERVGFLGPNGAGKTTTLKMLSGLLHPTHGTVRVDGYIPQARETAFLKGIMLVMGQKQQLLWDLPPVETFELNRAIYEVPRAEYRKRLDELVTLLDISEHIEKPARQLSLGERMKCELVAALIHAPRVLFLDEPTIGLDVSMQVALRDFIRRYNEEKGATLILTSHDMDDVAALCPRIIVIDKGQLTYDGDLRALAQKLRPEKRVSLRFSRVLERAEVEALGLIISHTPGATVVQVPQDRVNSTVSNALANLPVIDLNVENPPLEEIMSELFSRKPKVADAEPAPR